MEGTMRYVSEDVVEAMLRVDTGALPTLLLATNGSQSACVAAAYAAGLAYRVHGIVVAVHVMGDGESTGMGETIVEDARAIVEEWGVRCDTVLSDGDIHRELAWVARKVEADCVILGGSRTGQDSSDLAGKVMEYGGTSVVKVGAGWVSMGGKLPESRTTPSRRSRHF